jgi:hypothetical protein
MKISETIYALALSNNLNFKVVFISTNKVNEYIYRTGIANAAFLILHFDRTSAYNVNS